MALKNGKQCDLNDAVKRCLTNGLLLETDRDKLHLPYNKNEMNQICERLKKSEKCAKDFVDNCADSSKEKLVLENSLEGAVRVLKRVCRTNTKKTGLLFFDIFSKRRKILVPFSPILKLLFIQPKVY